MHGKVKFFTHAHTFSFGNANAGDLFINRRVSGYRRIVHKVKGLGSGIRELHVILHPRHS